MNDNIPEMTLRDYFVAHAPIEPKWYFKIDMSDIADEKEILSLNHWEDKRKEYEREHIKRRAIKWPYVWADAMLEERKRTEQ